MNVPKVFRTVLSLAALVVLLAGLLPGFLSAAPATPESSPHPRIVWVGYGEASLETLRSLAATLDIWEDRPEERAFLALVSPEEEAWLRAQGYRVEVVRVLNPTLDNPLDPRYYYFDSDYTNSLNRYIVDFLNEVNNTYPNIVELMDIGDAWQTSHGGHHRDIWVMRITNEDPAYGPISEKPPFFLFANIHAREVATPELAMRYIRYLTSGYNGQGGYGVDPDVTWLVDWNVVYVEVMQNPDGHRVNEQYSLDAYRRKNMDNDDGCGDPNNWGVDLNRNHNFMWGIDDNGSSPYPCYETYRGPSLGSEPETIAFQDFATTVFRDQNGPNGDYTLPPAAPVTTTGIFISLHSYSDYVLWPWGFTNNLSPNDAGMRKIGRKFAYYNGYNPIQHIWYLVNGSTDDWTYGKFGVPSYTFEVGYPGSNCGDDWFFFDYECIDGAPGYRSLWNENRPAFLYAHKIARTPYLTSYGPDAQDLAVSPNPVPQGQPVSLSALIQDHRCCGDTPVNIGGAEYFVDRPGQDGAGTPMSPQDGSWGGASETALATVDTCGLAPGQHYILVHGRSAGGNEWGPFTAVFLTVTPPVQCD
ncbi:MAG: M14 family zinc carboxypeptidase, partial [Chloroflexia bacterium]